MPEETVYVLDASGEVRTERRPVREHGGLPELTVVTLLKPATTDEGALVPAGTRGTIVLVYGEGEAYEVEFLEPQGLATVEAAALTA